MRQLKEFTQFVISFFVLEILSMTSHILFFFVKLFKNTDINGNFLTIMRNIQTRERRKKKWQFFVHINYDELK